MNMQLTNYTSILFKSLAELKANNTPETWLIKHWIAKGELISIIAQPAAGKSLLALEMALAMATGKDWRGEKIHRVSNIFYVIGEGQKGFIDRVSAYEIENNISVDNCPFYLSNTSIGFDTVEGLTQIINAIEQTKTTPDVIFIDTLARSFNGDENSASNMGDFVKNCNCLSLYFNNAAVVVIHHSGNSDKTRSRGSSALIGAVDKNYLLTVKENQRILSCTKSKNSAENDPKFFEIKSVGLGITDEDGDEISGAVLIEINSNDAIKKDSNTERALALTCLTNLIDTSGKATDAQWREKFYELSKDQKSPDAIRTAYNRHKKHFLEQNIVIELENYYYLSKPSNQL
ncbi:MAG: AAA family ATPase [Thiotrichales bacterium]|nr:AAA family ATPase [Thiotrichales bacterium]